MTKEERKRIEITFKNLLYFIENKADQEKAIAILVECENNMHDSKWKDKIDKLIYSTKKSYMDRVDYLVSDILTSRIDENKRKIILETISKLKPSVESASRSFWDKLKDLFSWS